MSVIPPGNVLPLDSSRFTTFLGDILATLWKVRRLKMDAVLDGELFSRVSSLLSVLSGAPLRVGFHPHTQEGLYRGSFINRPVPYNPYRHLSQQLLGMVEALETTSLPLGKGLSAPLPTQIPSVELDRAEIPAMRARLERDFPHLKNRPLVLLYAGGGALPIRAWPLDSYIRVARELADRGYAIGVIGMTEDCPVAQAIQAQLDTSQCLDLTGYTRSVRELLVLFHEAKLLITNDGGPGQFAALTPLPAIVFFGPETPLLYRPLSPRIHALSTDLGCAPCLTAYNHRRSPCDGDNQCLKRIAPEEVLALALRLLPAIPDDLQ